MRIRKHRSSAIFKIKVKSSRTPSMCARSHARRFNFHRRNGVVNARKKNKSDIPLTKILLVIRWRRGVPNRWGRFKGRETFEARERDRRDTKRYTRVAKSTARHESSVPETYASQRHPREICARSTWRSSSRSWLSREATSSLGGRCDEKGRSAMPSRAASPPSTTRTIASGGEETTGTSVPIRTYTCIFMRPGDRDGRWTPRNSPTGCVRIMSPQGTMWSWFTDTQVNLLEEYFGYEY